MAADSRRCTASQFFMEEEQTEVENINTHDKAVELLNQASLLPRDKERLTNLRLVQELIIHKEPALMDSFLDEMLAFQMDKSTEVRKFVVGFIEEACKKDPDLLTKLIPNLDFMLRQTDNVQVVKKTILSLAQVFKVALKWVGKAKKASEEMTQTWQYMLHMKTKIVDLIDSDNDGIRTHAIKFVESVVTSLSKLTTDSDTLKGAVMTASLDDVPENHPFLKIKKLEEESKSAFAALLSYQASSHISSVNLMTCLGCMTAIAKQRPKFMPQVFQGFEMLHVNLPPTLSKSQVSSVRKHLKMQMLSLLKHPASRPFHSQITTLLTDLGATQSEVMRALPKGEDGRKRKYVEEASTSTKKPKIEVPATPARDEDDDYGMMTPFVTPAARAAAKAPPTDSQKQSAIDITAEDLIPRLSQQNVADLVLLSMVMLPDAMPAQFQSTYTPIAAAGTQAQIKHLARLLATQLTAAGLGKGIAELQQQTAKERQEARDDDDDDDDDDEDDTPSSPKHVIQTVVGGATAVEPEPTMPPPTIPTPASMSSTRKLIRAFKLSAVTQVMARPQIEAVAKEAFHRILNVDKRIQQGPVGEAWAKSVVTLTTQFREVLEPELRAYILEDLRERADLALAWVYQEYANSQGYSATAFTPDKPSMDNYDDCLSQLLTGLLEKPDQKEGLFSRLVLEAPFITTSAIQILKRYCQEENRIYLGMMTLRELIIKRPVMKLEFLDLLLDFCSHEKSDVRNYAIQVTKRLHARTDLQNAIERFALYQLKFLQQSQPPQELFESTKGRLEYNPVWTEDNIKLCLYLYLALLPLNHRLIHELANAYTATTADIKRTTLRVLETPVKGMGMDSPELLLLVENCPKGAETLVTRIMHILTDKVAPSQDLVDRVRDLYQKRVSDIRFLIPVLTGLHKREVISALPKLIKLNPVVVKEVFNRLLGTQGQENYRSPLTPEDLLLALHNIDLHKCDMKTIIKATNLCFAEKAVYTQEVLAVVMQQLMEQNPLPTLLMRTVLQSLAMYPKLIGLVINIMQRLLAKQVWKQKKVWEGFIKCCQRTKPHCFHLLLQLPAPQLKNVFEVCPELREPLLLHVQTFTAHQRAFISKSIMTILEKDPFEEQRAVEKAKKEEHDRLAAQEKIYQDTLEEERRKQLKQKEQITTEVADAADGKTRDREIVTECTATDNKENAERRDVPMETESAGTLPSGDTKVEIQPSGDTKIGNEPSEDTTAAKKSTANATDQAPKASQNPPSEIAAGQT